MTSNKIIVPLNDFIIKDIDTEKGYYNQDVFETYKNNNIITLKKINLNSYSPLEGIDIFATLLNLSVHAKEIFIEINKNDSDEFNISNLQKYFKNKYNISRLTFRRALEELSNRNIVYIKDCYIKLNEDYNIGKYISSAKVLVIQINK